MNKEILYQASLEALEELFTLVGEKHWGQWIHKDLLMWVKERTADHHLTAYGGMGSLCDLSVLRYNGHKLEERQEPWMNACLKGLASIAYDCARYIESNRNIETLDGGEIKVVLSGWICKVCSSKFVTEGDILWATAGLWASSFLKKMLSGVSGKEIVRQGYNWEKDPECQCLLAQVKEWIAKNPIYFLTDVFHWEKDVCPNCSKKNWMVCQWRIDLCPTAEKF